MDKLCRYRKEIKQPEAEHRIFKDPTSAIVREISSFLKYKGTNKIWERNIISILSSLKLKILTKKERLNPLGVSWLKWESLSIKLLRFLKNTLRLARICRLIRPSIPITLKTLISALKCKIITQAREIRSLLAVRTFLSLRSGECQLLSPKKFWKWKLTHSPLESSPKTTSSSKLITSFCPSFQTQKSINFQISWALFNNWS